MKIWTNIWKLRRQKDEVKWVFLLIFLIIYLIWECWIGIVDYLQMIKAPVEYVLQKEGQISTLTEGMKKINEIDGVVMSSLQSEYTITLKENDIDMVLSIVELSESYLSRCYQIQEKGGMKQFYLNNSAYKELKKYIGETKESTSIQMTYSEDGNTWNQAKFILAESLPDDKPAAWCKGTSSQLEEREVMTRVMFHKDDISGSHILALQNLGYFVVNQEDILSDTYEQELLLQKLKYSMEMIALSSACIYLLLKSIKT